MRRPARAATLAFLVAPIAAAACRASAQSAADPAADAAPAPVSRMAEVVTDYSADRRSVRDFYTIDLSPTRLDREDALASTWKARLDALDFDALDPAGRIDWLLLETDLAHGGKRRVARRAKLAEAADLVPFAARISELEEARWHLEPVDPEQAATRLADLAQAVKELHERVAKPAGKDEAAITAESLGLERVPWPTTEPGAFTSVAELKLEPPTVAGGPLTVQWGTITETSTEGLRGRLRTARADSDKLKVELEVLLLPSKDVDARSLSDLVAVCREEGVKPLRIDEHWPAPPKVAPLKTTPVIARRAAGEVDALRAALESWFRHYDAFRPDFSWWTRQPYDDLHKRLEDYAKLLREEVAGLKGKDDDPLVGDPIGRQALVDDLAGEMIAYSPEELLAIGEREFAWCELQLEAAATEMGFGTDWKAALAKVKEDHVEPGAQDAFVAQQAKEAIAFLDEHDLITVPELCRETWRVRMIDRETQRNYPYAAYGGQDMLVAYPTSDMDIETRLMTMRGNNVHFSRIVVPHELIPGHHLQGFVAARSNTQRGEFSTPFLGEGWALYWELRLWDLGYARGPEDRIGMLFWRMHRAARIIVSLKFHLGQMQPQEMIDFLVERVGHEKAGATSEVRRYIGGDYGPLYQCAYMVGGLQLRALHDELVGGGASASGGERMTERQFHDAVLEQNSIPVEMIRAALTQAPLTRDWTPSWRFAGEVGAGDASAPAASAPAPH